MREKRVEYQASRNFVVSTRFAIVFNVKALHGVKLLLPEAPRCGARGIGQVAKLFAARAEVCLTRAFGSGTVRQGSQGRRSREGGLEVTVREQQGKADET